MKETIRVIVKDPGRRAQLREIPNTLEELQRIVGGFIETIRFDEQSVLIVNEEGKLRGLPLNFIVWNDSIVGPAIVAGVSGEDFTDVSNQTIRIFNAIMEDQR